MSLFDKCVSHRFMYGCTVYGVPSSFNVMLYLKHQPEGKDNQAKVVKACRLQMPEARGKILFVSSNSHLCFASAIAVMCAISCYIGPPYNGTRCINRFKECARYGINFARVLLLIIMNWNQRWGKYRDTIVNDHLTPTNMTVQLP